MLGDTSGKCTSPSVGAMPSYHTVSYLVIAGLSLAAAFFTIRVESFRRELNASTTGLEIASGQKVQVVRIIDGDEVSVRVGAAQFVVRILGVSAYDPGVNDPLTENVAKGAVRYLEKVILNNEVELTFASFQKDARDRVLSSIYKNGIDIGQDMIANGHAVVYTRYPFARTTEYLLAERDASTRSRGLWAIPAMRERSLRLKKVWAQERERARAKERKP